MVLVDDFFGSWRVWDAIRALDYLMSRPEIDTSRIGVTGNSGGGTLTSYVAALDPRPTMIAPGCFICSYLANIENELPSDAEQNPPGILASGLDQVDLLMCYAPRPTLILGQYQDFFDERYTRKSGAELKKIHSLLGSENTADVFIGPDSHGYHKANREAMYAWFMKHAGIEGTADEGPVQILDQKKLFATEFGFIDKPGAKRVFEFTSEKAAELRRSRKEKSIDELRKNVLMLMNIPDFSKVPHYRVLRNPSVSVSNSTGKRCEFAIETEKDIKVFAALYGNDYGLHFPKGETVIYIGNHSSEEDIKNTPFIKQLALESNCFAAVDPRGMGQSFQKTCGSVEFFESYGADYLYAATGEMLSESYLGRRVYDVLMTMNLFYSEGSGKISLYGSGIGSVIVAFAGLLHNSETEIRLFNYLPSYQIVADTPFFKWPFSSILRGALKYFDLPDIYRALGKRIRLESPFDAQMK